MIKSLNRGLKLIEILEDCKLHKSYELQALLGISNSSLRRYVQDLIYRGYQIESYTGKNGGYRLTSKERKCYNLDID